MQQDIMIISRSYAKAIFEFSLQYNTCNEWKIFLKKFDNFVHDKRMQIFFYGIYSEKTILNLFIIYAKCKINVYEKNLIKLLIFYKRFKIIKYIFMFFMELYNNYFNIMNIEIIFSRTISINNIKKICLLLQNICHKKIHLTYKIKPSIIDGIIIRSNDVIIDDCILSRINELSTYLLS
ncbi:ATP synthase subunit delta [Buchnera aphidicola (Pterocallis alni)]|uniref:ATP synthase F1 subunit delta n=1 Tax=Buchnera aphidicola TaxID=9 RepID=UPI0034644BC8